MTDLPASRTAALAAIRALSAAHPATRVNGWDVTLVDGRYLLIRRRASGNVLLLYGVTAERAADVVARDEALRECVAG